MGEHYALAPLENHVGVYAPNKTCQHIQFGKKDSMTE